MGVSISLSTLFQVIYGLNEIQTGLAILSRQVGAILGVLVHSRILDRQYSRVLRQYNERVQKTHGQNNSESLMKREANYIAPDFPYFPGSSRPHMARNCAFSGSFCLYGFYMSMDVLLVDLHPGKGASISGAANLARCVCSALFTETVELGFQSVGIGWTFTIFAVILILSNALLPLLIHRGPQWRAKRLAKEDQVHVTSDNNETSA
ncbi:hypothetical protein BCR43DRAFT_502566 [Syncephalastrum racemosum]|uniref:Major facilitator superfamily domain-containing protein n=1 Tax=Syncephalastrum racemosum TaxID=13706 RepID=A0A1X2HPU8_SYNRA|nr:hypothetical protein BCR43DRAFT_502566 [Syncephalastrum racemosum]